MKMQILVLHTIRMFFKFVVTVYFIEQRLFSLTITKTLSVK